MPLISIIIPTYNSEKFIEKTIKSALQQTLQDFELIVVDDCSTDNTVKVIEAIADSDRRIKIFTHTTNVGIAANRNRGIEKASGQYIAFLDHDDLWLNDKLAMQLAALEESKTAAVAYSWIDLIGEKGEYLRQHLRPKYTGYIYKKLLITNFLVTASNPLIRMKCLQLIGGFDETIYGSDDWELFIRLARDYEFILVKKCHIKYRIVQGSGTYNFRKFEEGKLRAVNKVFNQVDEPLKSLKNQALGSFYLYLSFKSLDYFSSRRDALISLRYMILSIHHDPKPWVYSNRLPKILLKLLLILIFPSSIAKKIIDFSVQKYRG
ncbi:MAG: glycosyltransferase family 2 protein [Prochlorotrichaceae cyanobacterium]